MLPSQIRQIPELSRLQRHGEQCSKHFSTEKQQPRGWIGGRLQSSATVFLKEVGQAPGWPASPPQQCPRPCRGESSTCAVLGAWWGTAYTNPGREKLNIRLSRLSLPESTSSLLSVIIRNFHWRQWKFRVWKACSVWNCAAITCGYLELGLFWFTSGFYAAAVTCTLLFGRVKLRLLGEAGQLALLGIFFFFFWCRQTKKTGKNKMLL